METLSKKIKNDPENLEVILQLAEIKFILGFLGEAKDLYKKARTISPDNIEIKKAEAKTRILLENKNLNYKTLDLLKEILMKEPNNLLALYVLGNEAYKENNDTKASKMFIVLKRLLKEGSQEYNEIESKLLEMEKRNEKN